MEKYCLNVPATQEVYRNNTELVRLKQCYHNIYSLASRHADKCIS